MQSHEYDALTANIDGPSSRMNMMHTYRLFTEEALETLTQRHGVRITQKGLNHANLGKNVLTVCTYMYVFICTCIYILYSSIRMNMIQAPMDNVWKAFVLTSSIHWEQMTETRPYLYR